MKKAIALLLALALVGGVVFAEDEVAPEAMLVKSEMAPVVTYGVSTGFTWNVYRSNSELVLKDKSADFESKDLFLGGFDYKNGQLFKVEPWAQVGFGPFWLKGTVGYKQSRRDPAAAIEVAPAADQIVKIASGLEFENLAITNTFVLDDNNYGDSSSNVPPAKYNDFELTTSKDNVEAGVLFRADMTAATNTTAYGDFIYAMDRMAVRDAYFAVSNIFDIMKVTVGGTDVNWSTNFRPYGMFPSTSVIYYSTANRGSVGLFWAGDNLNTVPVVTEVALEKFVGMPITVKAGSMIGEQDLTRDWLEGSNQLYSVDFAFDGIGKGDVGFMPAFAKAQTSEAAGVYTVDNRKAVVENSFFGDFKFTMVPNLTLNLGFDLTRKAYDSQIAADTTGTGAAATPYETKAISYSVIGLGLEAKYDLADVLAGLVVNAGLYTKMASGGDWQSKNGSAYVAPDANLTYVATNYTEATRLSRSLGAGPMLIALRADYKFAEDMQKVYLMNLLTPAASTFTAYTGPGATKTSAGYYSTNALTAGYSITAGKGTMGLDLGYTMYLGLPKDSDLGITAEADKVEYKNFLANAYRPLSLKVSYTAKF